MNGTASRTHGKLFDGSVAVVTGGARGIGWTTVQALVRDGATPVILDRDAEALAQARDALAQLDVPQMTECVDVTDTAAVDAAFGRVATRFGRLDILVNNAGIGRRKPAVDLSDADWRAVVDVNLNAVFACSRAAAKLMLPARRGAIVNVASMMGLSGGGLYPNAAYHATKGAVVNLTRALAVEWATQGIRVNAVAPTWVRTDLTHALLADAALLQRIESVTPMRCLAEPADVAEAIVFLASDRARMITGHTLPVDGGFLAQ
jgi:NAD(P)-dependent dehydrogenase (short-subunit alcohol dehydrogenase family)